MHATFNSKERTLREMIDVALSGGWQVTEVIRKPEGSLFGTIIAIPTSVPPSKLLVSPLIEQKTIDSPVVDTFYSRSRLPSSKGAETTSQSDSVTRRMAKRLRRPISNIFSRAGRSGESGNGENGRSVMAKSTSA